MPDGDITPAPPKRRRRRDLTPQLPLVQVERGGLPAAPINIKAEQAKADAVIAYAAQMKDWPLLEQALDLKIEQQREFADWWVEGVQRKGRPANGK